MLHDAQHIRFSTRKVFTGFVLDLFNIQTIQCSTFSILNDHRKFHVLRMSRADMSWNRRLRCGMPLSLMQRPRAGKQSIQFHFFFKINSQPPHSVHAFNRNGPLVSPYNLGEIPYPSRCMHGKLQTHLPACMRWSVQSDLVSATNVFHLVFVDMHANFLFNLQAMDASSSQAHSECTRIWIMPATRGNFQCVRAQ